VSYTPGPWEAKSYPSVDYPDGVWYVEGPVQAEEVDGLANGADARLIAAAPELLEALEQIARLERWQAEDGEASEIARVAIAKATEQSNEEELRR
jgi:hypothetical protein